MIQKKSLKDAIQNPEIISVVGGLLDVNNKVPIKFDTNRELFNGKNWVHLATIKNDYDVYSRTCSMMQVQFGKFSNQGQGILLLGIAHNAVSVPFVVALGMKDKSWDVGLKLAYYNNSNDNTTSFYITTNLAYGVVGKIWITKYTILNIINDNLSSIDTLPEGAVEIEP